MAKKKTIVPMSIEKLYKSMGSSKIKKLSLPKSKFKLPKQPKIKAPKYKLK